MNSRDTILRSIRDSFSDLKSRPDIPPVPEVWPLQHLTSDALTERFAEALASVLGECVLCTGIDDAAAKIKILLHEIGAKHVGVLDRDLSRKIADTLGADGGIPFHYAPENPDDVSPQELASWDASLLSPEFLLADTGSCLFKAPVAFDRILCYIAPLAVVVASTGMLREHLPHAWTQLHERFGNADTPVRRQDVRTADVQSTGEFLIMTGPSRTADIEKVLILGVHGPKRVVVFLID